MLFKPQNPKAGQATRGPVGYVVRCSLSLHFINGFVDPGATEHHQPFYELHNLFIYFIHVFAKVIHPEGICKPHAPRKSPRIICDKRNPSPPASRCVQVPENGSSLTKEIKKGKEKGLQFSPPPHAPPSPLSPRQSTRLAFLRGRRLRQPRHPSLFQRRTTPGTSAACVPT